MIMSPRRTSRIWLYFNKTEENRARCLYCKSVLSTAGGSFGNLRRHLKCVHPTVPLEVESCGGGGVALKLEDSSPDVPQLTDIGGATFKTDGESETYEDTPLEEPRSEMMASTRGSIVDAIQHLDRIAKCSCEDKEFEEFGRFVAAELRRVPRRQALLLQKEIQDSIFNVRIRAFE